MSVKVSNPQRVLLTSCTMCGIEIINGKGRPKKYCSACCVIANKQRRRKYYIERRKPLLEYARKYRTENHDKIKKIYRKKRGLEERIKAEEESRARADALQEKWLEEERQRLRAEEGPNRETPEQRSRRLSYQKNRESAIEYAAEYRKVNREKINEKNRAMEERSKERATAIQESYFEDQRQVLNAQKKIRMREAAEQAEWVEKIARMHREKEIGKGNTKVIPAEREADDTHVFEIYRDKVLK